MLNQEKKKKKKFVNSGQKEKAGWSDLLGRGCQGFVSFFFFFSEVIFSPYRHSILQLKRKAAAVLVKTVYLLHVYNKCGAIFSSPTQIDLASKTPRREHLVI
jgi:hypothetical protein